MHVAITKSLHDPCDRPTPTGEDAASHTHDDDGRVCAWDSEQQSWLTVRAVSDSEFEVRAAVVSDEDLASFPSYPQTPDQHALGLYPKFMVARMDGRDRPGADRDGAKQGYFVLDPIFDPAARPAMAIYAQVVRSMGYDTLADDIERNLEVITQHVSNVIGDAGDSASLRVVSTWTYDAIRAHYSDTDNVAGMCKIDQEQIDSGAISLEDLMPTDSAPNVMIIPNA